MFKYFKRFYYRYSYPVNVLGIAGLFVFIFQKPLYWMYFTTQTKEFLEGNTFIHLRLYLLVLFEKSTQTDQFFKIFPEVYGKIRDGISFQDFFLDNYFLRN